MDYLRTINQAIAKVYTLEFPLNEPNQQPTANDMICLPTHIPTRLISIESNVSHNFKKLSRQFLIMSEHKSFKISDFSVRNVRYAIIGYVILSLLAIGFGVGIESLPEFWSGLLLGAGGAMLASIFIINSLILTRPFNRTADISNLPRPSDAVRAICDDPGCSFIEAVKPYRDETGLGLSEAVAVLRDYQNRDQKD